MRSLRDQGVSILFVTHRLDEVMQVCSRIVILRDGEVAAKATRSDFTISSIIEQMVGRQASDLYKRVPRPPVPATAKPVISVRRLETRKRHPLEQKITLKDISFDLYPGEILGLAGLVGAGRTEVARAIFGADGRSAGQIVIDDKPANINSPADAMRLGIGLVSRGSEAAGSVSHPRHPGQLLDRESEAVCIRAHFHEPQPRID